MFDQILVCLDGSPLAEKILPLAQEIASGKGARSLQRAFARLGCRC